MSEAYAREVLGRLADRIERQPARKNRVIERLEQRAFLSDELQALHDILKAAAATGAVELVWGRHSTSHLVEKVVLADPEKLYGFLGRKPASQEAERACAKVSALLEEWLAGPPPDYVREIIAEMTAAWTLKRRPQGLGPGDWRELGDVMKGLIAVKQQPAGTLDLRSFSRKATGDSKLIERNMGRIAQHLKRLDGLPDYLEDARDVLAYYDLEKFPQAILVAGPLLYRGRPLDQAPYAGLAPEVAVAVSAGRQVTTILTIENLASFNRHVREARSENEIVLYSGGFPARRTLGFLRRLAHESGAACHHWGDIDLGGLRIAHHLHENLPRGLSLHLMSEELALAHGQPVKPLSGVDFPAASPISGLAVFLASEQAHLLEQEEIDPQRLPA